MTLGQLISCQFPCVVGQCTIREAKWYGKWCLSGAIPAGVAKGPYDTEDDACQAIEAAGWTRRPYSERQCGPHFDRPLA